MEQLEQIKNQILELHKEWELLPGDVENMDEFEWVEHQIQDLIVNYCESKGYEVDGFPFKMRQQLDEDEADEYFTHERYGQYLDQLALTHDDVAELLWFYHHTFWPEVDFWKDKESMLRFIRV